METSIAHYRLEEEWIASLRALFQKEDVRRRRQYAWRHWIQALTVPPDMKKAVRKRVNILA